MLIGLECLLKASAYFVPGVTSLECPCENRCITHETANYKYTKIYNCDYITPAHVSTVTYT